MGVRSALSGALAVQCVFGVLRVCAQPEPAGSTVIEELTEVGRASHRIAMFFPLLLGISARLAAIVPTFFLGVFGIFVFVAFSKKAFLVSLLALFLTYLDKYKHSRPKVVHIHHVSNHPSEFGGIDYYHPPHSPPKYFEYPGKKSVRKWPKIDHGSWTSHPSAMDFSMDSYIPRDTYLPQAARRIAQYSPSSFMLSPKGAFFPGLEWLNNTEQTNSSVMTPEFQSFIAKALEEEENDPR